MPKNNLTHEALLSAVALLHPNQQKLLYLDEVDFRLYTRRTAPGVLVHLKNIRKVLGETKRGEVHE